MSENLIRNLNSEIKQPAENQKPIANSSGTLLVIGAFRAADLELQICSAASSALPIGYSFSVISTLLYFK
jgi:hypothetical protein